MSSAESLSRSQIRVTETCNTGYNLLTGIDPSTKSQAVDILNRMLQNWTPFIVLELRSQKGWVRNDARKAALLNLKRSRGRASKFIPVESRITTACSRKAFGVISCESRDRV
jgi:hypothetical protein